MRRTMIALALMLVPAAVLAAPQAAPPQPAPQGNPSDVDLAHALCDSPDTTAEQTIAGCSALIKTGLLKGSDLADTYNNRATGYLAKKNYDLAIADENKAIADCSQAIKVNSGFAHYYRNRASAYLLKNKRAEALADLRTAIKYDPSDKLATGMLMSFAAKMSEGGAHIVDAKHPAPAALTARIQGAPPPGSIIVKPSDKKTGN